MNKYLYGLGLILIIFSCGGNTDNQNEDTFCDCKELSFDQPYNSYYLDAPRDGYTGTCKELNSQGNVVLEKNFKKGKLHGKYVSYYGNGQVEELKTFDMNLQAEQGYHFSPTGDTLFHGVFRYGRLIKTIFPR